MLYVYLVASAALIPLLNNFFDILKTPYSWWLVPVLFVAFFLGFIIIHALLLYVSVNLVNMDSPQERGARYYRVLITSSIRAILPLALVRIHSTGLDKVPSDGRFMLVCNHLQDFDPGVIINELPDRQLAFIAKKDIYSTMPFVAKALHKLQCLPIDRENNREAAKTVVSAIKLLKEDKVSIAVFPEGYCSKDGELQPLRNGVFKIAQKAGVPIVVYTLVDSQLIVKQMFRKTTNVYFDVLETIPTEKVQELSTAELGEHIHSLMGDAINQRRNDMKK
jgi:1-acyl-sn-glycerol-3-phosphate acyltransferase